jgi:cyclic-di-GMP phosphodiesterase, flagellum assembly factor TipF
VVTLPQRKIRWYELHVRLKTERGETLLPEDFQPHARQAGLLGQLDAAILFQAVKLVRRLQARNREVGLLVDIAPETLADGENFRALADFLAASAQVAPGIVLEIPQAAYAGFGPIEFEALATLHGHGFRFGLDHVRDLRFDTRDMADRGFRMAKVPASLMLGDAGALPADIHPADLAGLLARYGVDLVVDRIEKEATVVDILEYDVRLGQGMLFSPPRPVRADLLGEVQPERRPVAAQ